MRLSSVLQPLGCKAFRERHLGQRFVVIPGPSNRFSSLVPWDDLNRELQRIRVGPDGHRVRLVRGGTDVHCDEFLGKRGQWGRSLRVGRLERILSEGATLVLNSVEELFDELRALADDTMNTLERMAWCNLYASWGAEQGFNLHWDDHDTLICQVSGRKAWRVYEPTCHAPTTGCPDADHRPEGEPVWEGVLESGTVLYMPRGWWHVAVPMSEPTLHVTIGLKALQARDCLEILNDHLRYHDLFRIDAPDSWASDGRAYGEQLIEVVRNASLSLTLSDIRARFLAARLRQAEPALPDAVRPVSRAPQSVVFVSDSRGLQVLETDDGRCMVTSTGREWHCSRSLAKRLRRLSSSVGQTLEELTEALNPSEKLELACLIAAMQNEGELVIRQPQDVSI